jgi:rare lipoprotein A
MGRQFAGTGLCRATRAVAAVAACLFFAQCSGQYGQRVVEEGEPVPKGGGTYRVGKPYSINGRIYVPHENPSYRAEGIASWYGRDFHGRLTANGEVYDMHAISAAHPTMPLPSYARVTNLDNGRSMIVRVNDRGPYARSRLIDLSIGAAKALAFYGSGLARVRVEYVGRAPLEGSDDEILMATLREGSPAPAPSKVMVAAAKPFLPDPGERMDTAVPLDRSIKVAGSPRSSEGNAEKASAGRSPVRVQSASADSQPGWPAPTKPAPQPPAARADAPSLGLMSGRGLY